MSWLKIAFHVSRLSVLWPDAHSQFKAPMTGEKQLVWLPPLDMERVRAMSKRMGVTLNDVWVAAVSGALRKYLTSMASAPMAAPCVLPSPSICARRPMPSSWGTSSVWWPSICPPMWMIRACASSNPVRA
jgi:uncharacterized protein YneF (UPF0154 family)